MIAALIAIAPVLLIVILVALVAVVNRRSLQGVFQRATKVGVAGVFELELDTQSIKEAREDAPLSDQQASALDRESAGRKPSSPAADCCGWTTNQRTIGQSGAISAQQVSGS